MQKLVDEKFIKLFTHFKNVHEDFVWNECTTFDTITKPNNNT